MPYEEPDDTDPLELVGIELPGDISAWREMAECFAVEYARLGFSMERIRQLFSSPLYAGPYQARQLLGEETIRQIIAEAAFLYGARKSEVQDTVSNEGPENYPPPGPCEQHSETAPANGQRQTGS